MRVLALAVMLAALACAARIGIARIPEDYLTDKYITDMRQAVAAVFACSLIAMAIAFRTRSTWGIVSGVIAGASFLLSLPLLAANGLGWSKESLLTFALVFAGGLVALAISTQQRQPDQPSPPAGGEPKRQGPDGPADIRQVGDGSIGGQRPDGLLGPDQADADLMDEK